VAGIPLFVRHYLFNVDRLAGANVSILTYFRQNELEKNGAVGSKKGARVLKTQNNPTASLPGADPMITSYNASVVKIYNAVNSIARF
jgi:hypothetical protein